jgi:hypothetical protein
MLLIESPIQKILNVANVNTRVVVLFKWTTLSFVSSIKKEFPALDTPATTQQGPDLNHLF